MERTTREGSVVVLTGKRTHVESTDESSDSESGTNEQINLVAYDVKSSMSRNLLQLIALRGIAREVIMIMGENIVGILMSFQNWEEVAKFREWSFNGTHTQQLLRTIRVTCGPVTTQPPSTAFIEAVAIIKKRSHDEGMDNGGIPRIGAKLMDTDGPYTRAHFAQYLFKGVYCRSCKTDHEPVSSGY